MPARRQIRLHIGATKTGSSALQMHLFEARHALLDRGILYSETGVASNAHHLVAACLHEMAWRIHRDVLPEDRKDRLARFRDYMAAILDEADRTGAHTIVLSSEYLWGAFRPAIYAPLRAAVEGFDVTVVCALRRQDRWLESSYLQAAKSGAVKADFAEWQRRFRAEPRKGADYLTVLHRYQTHLGGAAVRVAPYDSTAPTAFMREMANLACGAAVGDIVVASDAKIVNRSPNREGLERLLELGRNGTGGRESSAVRQILSSSLRDHGTTEPVVLTPELQTEILEAYADRNRRLTRRYAPDYAPDIFAGEEAALPSPAD